MITSGFIAIWIAWLMAGGSPGPATMGIAGTAMNEGRRAGLVFALGICAGSAAWGIAAALGLSAIMLANVWVFEMIRYVGVAYLGWLALKALKRALSSDEMALGNPVTGSLRAIFAKGAAIHLTNPKAILSWGSIYAIVAPNDASLPMLLGYFGLLYAGSLLIFISYAFLFSSERTVRAYRRARRWFDFAFAGFFGVASYKILTVRLS
ncbi:LysE family translocator [Ruegeria faecimaris]|uniref:Threonine/homoserine/homoserine lactone efflux protein n=1 Tax=Ruegeria faecimaris TaxID=686389 RepID=A0A521ESR5_9RHOB|nr:LysE family translocator [Ruegeria faecimaris]SMO86955.1 Threonine/homoserine/homoserine lactone efflux protein [Ruegeria faecimaris]